MYIVDTNVLVYAFEGIEPYASFVKGEVSNKGIAISVITVSEFIVGLDDDLTALFEEFINSVDIFDVNTHIARVAGDYRRNSKKTKKVYLLDCLIAATAKNHNLTLVTKNKKDYPMKDIKVMSLN